MNQAYLKNVVNTCDVTAITKACCKGSLMRKLLPGILPCLAIAQLQAGEYWIGWGTTASGDGSMAAPRICVSASDFDSVMASQAVQTPGTKVHLLAGTFLTAQGVTLPLAGAL